MQLLLMKKREFLLNQKKNRYLNPKQKKVTEKQIYFSSVDIRKQKRYTDTDLHILKTKYYSIQKLVKKPRIQIAIQNILFYSFPEFSKRLISTFCKFLIT